MARREYSVARRILMQAVLCAALGLSIALAWWVQQVHAAALAFKLGPPVRFDNSLLPLDLRLPDGWTFEIESDEPGDQGLLATETQSHYGSARELEIRLLKVRRGIELPTAEAIAGDENHGRPQSGPSQRLDFLGGQGIFVQYPVAQSDVGEDVPKTYKPTLFACVVLSQPRVAVSLTLVGKSMLNPTVADAALLKAIAKSMNLSDLSQKVDSIKGLEAVNWRDTTQPVAGQRHGVSPIDTDAIDDNQ